MTGTFLKWKEHISLVANKTVQTLGVMNKIKHFLTSAYLKNLYQSLIEPYLTYCCIVWAKPDKSTALETLLKLQKRSVRIISHSWYRACSRPLFHKFSILNIYDLCLLQILVFVYESINYLLLPNSYTQYFTKTSDIHYYKTRGHKYNLYRINAQTSASARRISRHTPSLSPGVLSTGR